MMVVVTHPLLDANEVAAPVISLCEISTTSQ